MLRKTLNTKNSKLALKTFRKYNSDEYPDMYATILKKKGGDNTFSYVVYIYQNK